MSTARDAVPCRACGAIVPTARIREFAEVYRKAMGLPRMTVHAFGMTVGLSSATLSHALRNGYITRETARRICVHLNAATGRTGKRNAYTWRDFFPKEKA